MVLLPCRSSCATHPPGKLSNALQLKIKFACRPYGGSGSGAACLNVMFALGYVASSQRITRTSHCRSALLVSPSWQVPTIRWHATRALDSGRHQPIGSMRHARTSTCYTPPQRYHIDGLPCDKGTFRPLLGCRAGLQFCKATKNSNLAREGSNTHLPSASQTAF